MTAKLLQFPGGPVDVACLRETDDGTLLTTIRGKHTPVSRAPEDGLAELDKAICELRHAVLSTKDLNDPQLQQFFQVHNRLKRARRWLRRETGR